MRLIRRIGPWVAAVACFVGAITVIPTAWGPVAFVAAALLVSFALFDGSRAPQVSDDEFPSSAWRLRPDADGTVLEQIALAAYFDRSPARHRLLRLLTGALVYLPMLAFVGVLGLAMAMPGFSPGVGATLAILALGAFLLVPVVMFHRRGRNPVWFRLHLRDARLELNGAAAGWNRTEFVRRLDAAQCSGSASCTRRRPSDRRCACPAWCCTCPMGKRCSCHPCRATRRTSRRSPPQPRSSLGICACRPIASPCQRDNLRLPADGKGA